MYLRKNKYGSLIVSLLVLLAANAGGVSRFPKLISIFKGILSFRAVSLTYEGVSKSFEPNMERARNLDLFCFIFQRSPLPTPHTCPI